MKTRTQRLIDEIRRGVIMHVREHTAVRVLQALGETRPHDRLYRERFVVDRVRFRALHPLEEPQVSFWEIAGEVSR